MPSTSRKARIMASFFNLMPLAAGLLLFKCLSAQAPSKPAAGIAMVQVAGHAMRVRAANLGGRRPGQPIVVLESGSVSPIENWNPIFDQIAAIAPVVSYDRRGIGKSEFDGQPQTLEHVASSLHALLSELKAAPPYVLVGHSYGGILIMAFAQQFPSEVRGLVYLDAPDVERTYAEMDAISPDTRRVVMSELDHFPTGLPPGMQAELDNLRQLLGNDMAELRSVRPSKGLPTGVVIAAGKYARSETPLPPEIAASLVRLQIRHEQEWALSSPNGLLLIANHVGHAVHQDDPALVMQVIRHVLSAASEASKK
jgi:pimeloyl-ACP methyl ester carboxylesterase